VGNRRSEQVSLAQRAAQVAEHPGLSLALDPLGDHGQSEVAAQADQVADQPAQVWIGVHLVDQALVQLHRVHRQSMQHGQRGAAGPDIVQRDLDPGLTQ